MTADLYQNPDGANHQARAVLAYLGTKDGIERSWSEERKRYLAEPRVARWENGREQGYVVYLRSQDYSRQINIAFFEHRNSDEICAVVWEQVTHNSPTIDTMNTGGKVYTDKFDVSHTVGPGQAAAMADWINEQLENFWVSTRKSEAA